MHIGNRMAPLRRSRGALAPSNASKDRPQRPSQALVPVEEGAARRGIRTAGLFVEADRLGMTALAGLVNDGRLTPPLPPPPPRAGRRRQSAKSGPGKTVLTLV